MPKVKNVEKNIWEVEGFDIQIQHLDGKDVHGAKAGLPTYPYEKQAKNSMTVREWKDKRFGQVYPGYDVAVLDGDGVIVTAGNTHLGTVRDSYSESD